MNRLVVLFIALCVTAVKAEEQTVPPEPELVRFTLPIYRGAETFIPKFQAVTQRGPMTTTIDVEKTIAAYPEPMRPWNPDDLENVKIFLPLGDGEEIDDKLYRFTLAWNESIDKPLRIQDFRFSDYSHITIDNDDVLTLSRKAFRYRPVELVKDNLVRLKFEFVPIKFTPLDLTDSTEATDFSNWIGNIRDKTAPKPEFLDPIVIHTVQMNVLVNKKNTDFKVHFSRDGEKWYGTLSYDFFPFRMLPFETLFVRVATDNGVPIDSLLFDFEAILETPGFRGTGETLVGRFFKNTSENRRNIDYPAAFFDSHGDLNLLIDNPDEEPYAIGGWLAHNYSSRHRFGGGMGGFNSDGFFVGPTVPAKSSGVYTFTTSKDEGNHHYVLSGFSFSYQCAETDRTGPNPPPGTFRMQTQGNEQPRSKEYKPEDGRPFVTFDDDIPAPSR